MSREKGFDNMVLQAVDEGLMVLGIGVRSVLYHHVERTYQIRREEIPTRIVDFHNALEHLLGSGARIVENLAVKSLYNELGLSFKEQENWTLVDHLNHAKRSVEK